MKRIIPGVLVSLFFSAGLYAGQFDDYTNQLVQSLNNILASAVSPVSVEMARHMGYYTGSGNVTPVNTSGDFGIKFGLDAGVNTSDILYRIGKGDNIFSNTNSSPMTNYVNAVGQDISIVPFPYDDAYFKLGIPTLPMDVGIRLGFIPSFSFSTGTGSTISFYEFRAGVEGRYLLWSFFDMIKIDARLSVDYDTGNVSYSYSGSGAAYDNSGNLIGTNSYNAAFAFNWGGVSIGTKVMAGLNVPFIGGPFVGLGLNLNLGGVKTSLTMNDTFTANGGLGQSSLPALSAASPVGYNLLDLRLIAGVHLFFLNGALEYGLLNNDLAWTAGICFAF